MCFYLSVFPAVFGLDSHIVKVKLLSKMGVERLVGFRYGKSTFTISHRAEESADG